MTATITGSVAARHNNIDYNCAKWIKLLDTAAILWEGQRTKEHTDLHHEFAVSKIRTEI